MLPKITLLKVNNLILAEKSIKNVIKTALKEVRSRSHFSLFLVRKNCILGKSKSLRYSNSFSPSPLSQNW